jgi:hypothetical protein
VLVRYRLATSWTIRALNPGGGEIFRAHPYWDVALTTDIPLLAPSLCMVRVIPLPPFCAFMACYRVAVTLTFKADSHIACRANAVPMPSPCHAVR